MLITEIQTLMKKLIATGTLVLVAYMFSFQLSLSSCTKPHDSRDSSATGTNPAPPGPTPIDSANMIYIGGRLNDLYAIKASTGQLVWSRTVSGSFVLPPVYTHGILAIRGEDGYITAFDTSGKQLWRIPPVGGDPGEVTFSPVAGIGTIYSQDYFKIYAINAVDGSIKWSYDKHGFQSNGSGGIIIDGNALYTTDKAGDFMALDLSTGAELWKTQIAVISWQPYVQNGLVYAGGDGNFKVLDARTGAIKFAGIHPDGYTFNMQHGRIYHIDGSVYDSSNLSTAVAVNPIVQVPFLPWGVTYPILSDSLVILTTGVFNAYTGQLVCYPFNVDTGVYLSGASYVGGVLFYSGGQREAYNPYGYYSDVYAYDVKGNKTIWRTQVENADLVQTEPVVVTKSGVVYKGAFVTR
jgi:outer membrane protein assembly factor BamB